MRFPFTVTDRKALKGCLPFTWNWPIWFKLNREELGTDEKNKKAVNGTKFTGWNVPIGKRGQPFQTNLSFRKSSGWAIEICLFHLLSVWNDRNFHVNGKVSSRLESWKNFRESYLKELDFPCSEVLHPQAKQTRTLPQGCKTSNIKGIRNTCMQQPLAHIFQTLI
jgi:hypothetical protein